MCQLRKKMALDPAVIALGERSMYVDLLPDRPDQFADSESDPVEALVTLGLLFCFCYGRFQVSTFL